jgi:hypothetical protein
MAKLPTILETNLCKPTLIEVTPSTIFKFSVNFVANLFPQVDNVAVQRISLLIFKAAKSRLFTCNVFLLLQCLVTLC